MDQNKSALNISNDFNTAMHDARSIIGTVIAALCSEADPVDPRQASSALRAANKMLEQAEKNGDDLWEIISQQMKAERKA